MGVNGQRYAPAAPYSRERTPNTHWIGGWAGLRAILDTGTRGKSFASAGDRTSVARSSSLLSDIILTELPKHVCDGVKYSSVVTVWSFLYQCIRVTSLGIV
jgi:hypothetical protein